MLSVVILGLRDTDKSLAVGVQYTRFGDKAQIAVVAVHDGKHPCMVLLETRKYRLHLLVLEDLVRRLTHVVYDGTAPHLSLEHILAQVIQLHNTQQMSEVVDHGEYVSMGRRYYPHKIPKREVLLYAHEVGP